MQLGCQFTLFLDAFENGRSSVLHFAQIPQAVLQLAQLNVVQPSRDLFAVTGNEGHCCATVQQLNSRFDLVRTDLDFCGQLAHDFLHFFFLNALQQSERVCHMNAQRKLSKA